MIPDGQLWTVILLLGLGSFALRFVFLGLVEALNQRRADVDAAKARAEQAAAMRSMSRVRPPNGKYL